MTPSQDKQDLLKQLPPMTELLKGPRVADWLRRHPRTLVVQSLRGGLAEARSRLVSGGEPISDVPAFTDLVLNAAEQHLQRATTPHLRTAINATGVILHTGLGRAVFPSQVVDAMTQELRGYSNLAVDRDAGERIERDELVEYILTELTGAEAATVVNNNAAATLLVLAALAAGKEVLVSRGQLIEIGGSFRLPDVMKQSGARMLEVGTTNRTHLKDYEKAITAETAVLLRVHPSNYRIVGFTTEPGLAELTDLAHRRGLVMVDDLGAGALVPLEPFGLPHEPTVRESIDAGADIVLFSGDKLIGASQSGIIVGRKELVARVRRHPLKRAVRIDKTCLLILERTLHLFRNPESLPQTHPTYRMLTTPLEALENRARRLADAARAMGLQATVEKSEAYVGSGSLPTQGIPSVLVSTGSATLSAAELARRLRMDEACVFGRIEGERVCLDMRTITDDQVALIAAALRRSTAAGQT